jgi:hypothetical protein
MQTAVEARMRVFGVSRDIAQTDAMGSPLQRLQHYKIISPEQAIAGYDFAFTMREYLATAKLQKPSQGKAGFVPATPDNSEGPAVRGESKAKEYMVVLRETDRLDGNMAFTTTSVVWDVCVNENDRRSEAEIGALRVGLNAIHRVMYGKKAA